MAKMTKAQIEQFNKLINGMHQMIRARWKQTNSQEAYLEAVANIDEIINPTPPEEEEVQ